MHHGAAMTRDLDVITDEDQDAYRLYIDDISKTENPTYKLPTYSSLTLLHIYIDCP